MEQELVKGVNGVVVVRTPVQPSAMWGRGLCSLNPSLLPFLGFLFPETRSNLFYDLSAAAHPFQNDLRILVLNALLNPLTTCLKLLGGFLKPEPEPSDGVVTNENVYDSEVMRDVRSHSNYSRNYPPGGDEL